MVIVTPLLSTPPVMPPMPAPFLAVGVHRTGVVAPGDGHFIYTRHTLSAHQTANYAGPMRLWAVRSPVSLHRWMATSLLDQRSILPRMPPTEVSPLLSVTSIVPLNVQLFTSLSLAEEFCVM